MSVASERTSESGVKSAVVILGMHRSGTSALSRALSWFLGYAQPTDLTSPQPDNPTGFWESRGIIRLNTSIMEELGFAWDQPKLLFTPGASIELSRERIQRWVRERHLAAANEALAHSYDGERRIVIKDPRLCLLADLWEAALAQSGYHPTYVLIHRNPLEVARSLKQRNDIGPARAQQLWLQYNLASLGVLARQGRGRVVAYADLLEQRHALIERLSEGLGIAAAPMTIDARAELDQFLNADLRHHNLPPAADSPPVPAIVTRMQALLFAWNELAPDARQVELAAIVVDFEQHSRFAGNLKAVRLP